VVLSYPARPLQPLASWPAFLLARWLGGLRRSASPCIGGFRLPERTCVEGPQRPCTLRMSSLGLLLAASSLALLELGTLLGADNFLGTVLRTRGTTSLLGDGLAIWSKLHGLDGFRRASGVLARTATLALADGHALGVGQLETIAGLRAGDVVGSGLLPEVSVHEDEVTGDAIDVGDDVRLRIEPGLVAENGGVAFDDDTVSDLGEKDGVAKRVLADGVFEVIDDGL